MHPLINMGEKHSPEVRALIKGAQLWTLKQDTAPPSAKSLHVTVVKSLQNSPLSMEHFSSSAFKNTLGASEES